MKTKYISLALSFFIYAAAFSQSKDVIIKGNIKLKASNSAFVDTYCFSYFDLLSGKTIIIPISRDSNNNYEVNFQIDGLKKLKLSPAMTYKGAVRYDTGMSFESFYVMPGQQMEFNKNDNHKRIQGFKGDFAVENQQYQAFLYALELANLPRPDLHARQELKSNYPASKEIMLKNYQLKQSFHSQYFKTQQSLKFVREQSAYDLAYRSLNDLINFMADQMTDSMVTDFLKELNLPLINAKAEGNEEYTDFLHNYYQLRKNGIAQVAPDFSAMADFMIGNAPDMPEQDQMLLKLISDTAAKVTNQELAKARDYMNDYYDIKSLIAELNYFMEIKSPALRDLLSSMLLHHELENRAILYIQPELEKYKALVKNEGLRDEFFKRYQSKRQALANSKISSKATIHSISDVDATTAFDQITSKYRGKVIYLDVWATWCSPCLNEMKNSKILREKLVGKDVVFVYLCFNSSSSAKWKELIAAYQIEGEHYFLSYEQSTELSKFLNFKAVPHYVLMNKQGEIIEKQASYPGEPETLEKINKLL